MNPKSDYKEIDEDKSNKTISNLKSSKFLSNAYIKILFHSRLNFIRDLNIYKRIRDLNIINIDEYLKIHPTCLDLNYDPILHYIFFSSETDDITTKTRYIDEIFHLNFYRYDNNLSNDEDPLIHYVTKGFFNNAKINRKDEGFIKNLREDINEQWERNLSLKISKELENNNYIHDTSVLIPYISSNDTYDTETLKIGVFLEDTFDNMNACPSLRIDTPFRKLAETGDYHFFIYGKELMPKLDFDNFMSTKCFDVILIQRTSLYYELLIDKAKEHDIKIIYETDDALLEIESTKTSYPSIERQEGIIEILKNAEKIIVSTPNLANSFKKMGYDNTYLIRNYYAYNMLPMNQLTDSKNKIKIGYFGTTTHNDDLKLIYEVIFELKNNLKKQYDIDLEFEIVGGTNLGAPDWASVIELPFYPMSMLTFIEWLNSEINWDIGVAPLKDSPFNWCKSEIKYIEFTALGVPVVASKIGAYEDAIEDNISGFLAEGNVEWYNKLKKLVLNEDFRKAMVNNARDNVFKNYNINNRIAQWDKVFKEVAS